MSDDGGASIKTQATVSGPRPNPAISLTEI
jgi:hypothetical protein